MQLNVPEEWRPRQHCSGSLKSRKFSSIFEGRLFQQSDPFSKGPSRLLCGIIPHIIRLTSVLMVSKHPTFIARRYLTCCSSNSANSVIRFPNFMHVAFSGVLLLRSTSLQNNHRNSTILRSFKIIYFLAANCLWYKYGQTFCLRKVYGITAILYQDCNNSVSFVQ